MSRECWTASSSRSSRPSSPSSTARSGPRSPCSDGRTAKETDEDIGFRDVSRHRDVETFPGLVIFRFDQEIFFANATFFRDQIRHLVDSSSPPPRTILVDAEAITHIDSTAIDTLAALHDELSAERISLAFARIKSPVRDKLSRAGLVERFGRGHFYPTLESGVAAFLADSSG